MAVAKGGGVDNGDDGEVLDQNLGGQTFQLSLSEPFWNIKICTPTLD